MRSACVIAATLVALPAVADEGELYVGGGAAIEAGWLRHPLVADEAFRLDAPTAFALMPRVALDAQVGLTNDLHVGVGLAATGAGNVVTDGAALGGVTGQLITGGYFELAAPISASWRIDSGYDFTATLRADIAPMVALWSANALADPTKLDDAGRPALLPIEIDDELRVGADARLHLLFEARVFDSIALRIGPTVAVAWAGTPSAYAGLSLEPAWIVVPSPR